MGISKSTIRTSLRGRYLPTGQAGDRSNLNIKAYCIRLLLISFLVVRNDDEVFRDAIMSVLKKIKIKESKSDIKKLMKKSYLMISERLQVLLVFKCNEDNGSFH